MGAHCSVASEIKFRGIECLRAEGTARVREGDREKERESLISNYDNNDEDRIQWE